MNILALYNQALQFINEGKPDEAYKAYMEIINKGVVEKKLLASIYNDLGVLFYSSNQIDKAAEHFMKASELNPGLEDLKENLRLIVEGTNDFLGIVNKKIHDVEKPGTRKPSALQFDRTPNDLIAHIPKNAQRILDIGCGKGDLAFLIRRDNKEVEIIGIEPDETAAVQARQILNKVYVADVEDIDFICPDGFFDCIIYNGILEHIKDPWRTLTMHRKYLKDSGTVVAIVPNIQHFSVLLGLFSGRWEYRNEGIFNKDHIRYFTFADLKKMFKEAGFVVDNLTPHILYPLPEKFQEFIKLVRPLDLLSRNFETETSIYYFSFSAKKSRLVRGDEEVGTEYSPERINPGKSDWKLELQDMSSYQYFQPLCRKKKVLEAGCGVGEGTYVLSRLASNITAIDKDFTAIAYAEKHYKKENIEYKQLDFMEFKTDEKFDRIYSIGVIEQVDDFEKYIEKLKSHLSEDGLLIISTANKNVLSPDSEFPSNPFHKKEFVKDEFVELMKGYFPYCTFWGQIMSHNFIILKDMRDKDINYFAVCSNKEIHDTAEKLDKAYKESMVSIVVVTNNMLEHTRQCLESIVRFTYCPYEIIIVDNASTDDTVEHFMKRSNLKFIGNKENLGFIRACNQGLNLAEGKYVVFTHNDVVFSHDWLSKMLNCMYKDEKVGAVGPYSNYAEGEQKIMTDYADMDEYLNYSLVFEETRFEKSLKVDFLDDFCLLTRKDVIEKAGGLPISTADNFKKFIKSVKKAGFKTVIAEDTFLHHMEVGKKPK